VDGLLEFSCYIPTQDFGQVMAAWRACKLANGKGCGIGYDQWRAVSWRFTKNREVEKRSTMLASSDFSSGSTSRWRARA